MKARSIQLFSPSRGSLTSRRVQGVTAYAGVTTAFGRCGARWYGLVYDNAPVLAFFIDDGWYEPALSFGLAIGPIEFGLFFKFLCPAEAQADISGGAAP